MHNHVVRVCRASSAGADSISGVLENIQSGQKDSFHNFTEPQALLSDSSQIRQFELPYNPTPEEKPGKAIAVKT